jgi:hypothetical protein
MTLLIALAVGFVLLVVGMCRLAGWLLGCATEDASRKDEGEIF